MAPRRKPTSVSRRKSPLHKGASLRGSTAFENRAEANLSSITCIKDTTRIVRFMQGGEQLFASVKQIKGVPLREESRIRRDTPFWIIQVLG